MYLAHFADYNVANGSLGAVIGLMMWLRLTLSVVLVGAGLDTAIADQFKLRRTAQPSP